MSSKYENPNIANIYTRKLMPERSTFAFFLLLLAVGVACKDSGVASAYVDVEPLVLHANGQGFVGS